MFRDNPLIQNNLKKRNELLSAFWFSEPDDRHCLDEELIGRKVLMVDAEDTFTEMLSLQLRSLGLLVTIRKFNAPYVLDGNWDLVVMGPGPGDPRNINNERIAKMQKTMAKLVNKNLPFLAVCLSHQILCLQLGLDLVRRQTPNQGVQREINLFGKKELVGFYNTYIAKCDETNIKKLKRMNIEVSLETTSGEVYSLRGPSFSTLQFHPESLLTHNGVDIIANNVKGAMNL